MDISAILFDCDGVLVDSEIVGLDDAMAYLSGHGFRWTAEYLISRFTGMRSDELKQGMTEEFFAVHDRHPQPDEIAEIFDGYVAVRRAKRHLTKIVPDAFETINAAVNARLKLAVASSSGADTLARKIKRLGFSESFGQHVFSADLVSEGKPAPDIFLYAANALGIAASNALVVEDSVNGVLAGRRAGCEVWGFIGGGHCLPDHQERLKDAGASAILSTHRELATFITERCA